MIKHKKSMIEITRIFPSHSTSISTGRCNDCVCVCVFYRAFVYLSQNNYAEAHASFIEVLKIDPKNPVVSSKHIFYFQHLYTAGGDLKDLM